MTTPDSHKSSNKPEEHKESSLKKQSPRRSIFHNLLLTLKHISDSSLEESVKQRFSDNLTFLLVIVCILSLVAAIALPVSLEFKLVPLGLSVIAVLFHLINRMGILATLTARQAYIIWQILVGTLWLGITTTILVMMSSIYWLGHTH